MSAQQDNLSVLYPAPWSWDPSPWKVPVGRRSARVYAGDNSPVCRLQGPHSHELAQFIVASCNRNLSLLITKSEEKNTDSKRDE